MLTFFVQIKLVYIITRSTQDRATADVDTVMATEENLNGEE